jgi:hypothetical protein
MEVITKHRTRAYGFVEPQGMEGAKEQYILVASEVVETRVNQVAILP